MLSVPEYRYILRNDLMSFVERSFYELNPQTAFKPAPHIEVIVSKLEACRRGEIRRLIVNLPPRHLKSHTVSIAFVAWLLGHSPAAQIIAASYGQDLADKLVAKGKSLTTAAHEAGFADSAHFSRTFKRMFGIPAAALQIL